MSYQRFTDPGDNLPTHAPNGAKIVKWDLEIERESHMNHYMPPSPPTRTVTEWDEDDVPTDRTLTDDEFTAWEARYAKASAEYKRTCGTFMTFGQTTHTLSVECENGTTGRAMSNDGVEWQWVQWSGPACGQQV